MINLIDAFLLSNRFWHL